MQRHKRAELMCSPLRCCSLQRGVQCGVTQQLYRVAHVQHFQIIHKAMADQHARHRRLRQLCGRLCIAVRDPGENGQHSRADSVQVGCIIQITRLEPYVVSMAAWLDKLEARVEDAAGVYAHR